MEKSRKDIGSQNVETDVGRSVLPTPPLLRQGEDRLEKAVDDILFVYDRYGTGHQFAEALTALRGARGTK